MEEAPCAGGCPHPLSRGAFSPRHRRFPSGSSKVEVLCSPSGRSSLDPVAEAFIAGQDCSTHVSRYNDIPTKLSFGRADRKEEHNITLFSGEIGRQVPFHISRWPLECVSSRSQMPVLSFPSKA
jgi:hypothetical protein